MKFISGLANCHTPGVYSFVLSERESRERGMRRVFFTTKGLNLWDGADFLVKPHNHRQSIRLSLLFGHADNVSVKTGFGEHRLWCYKFGSALLNGDFSLERLFCADAHLRREPITRHGIQLHWSDVHTVTAAPMSAWLVEEEELAPEAGLERLWSVNHALTLSNEGLYQEMSPDRLQLMENFINSSTRCEEVRAA